MEEMADMCKVLEEENQLLQQHLDELNGVPKTTTNTHTQIQQINPTVAMVSPYLSPTTAPTERSHNQKFQQHLSSSSPSTSFDQMKILLDAAGVFDLSSDINSDDIKTNNNNNGNNSSCAVSISSEDHRDESSRPLKKRRRFHPFTSSTLSDTEDGCSN